MTTKQPLHRRVGMICVAGVGMYFICGGAMRSCDKMKPPVYPYPVRLPNGMTPEDMHERAMRQRALAHILRMKP